MVIVIILNFLFIGLFMILVKLIYQEIKVKISQKASGILLSSNLNFNQIILILNLKQILVVWTSITIIKLGEFSLFPGKDLVLISAALVSIKILNSSKEVLVADICSALSVLILGVVIGLGSHGSVLEPLSNLLASVTLVIPLLMWLTMLFSTFLICLFPQMKIILPVITSVIITLVILSSVKKVKLKHTILSLILVLATLSSIFMPKHPGKIVFHMDSLINNSFYENQVPNLSQSRTGSREILRMEKMYLQNNQETIRATSQKKMFELKRDFLIVSYISNEHQCELNAIDVSDQNMFVKAFLRVILPLPRSISQFITANGLFSSLKLQGFAKDCRALIGSQITASILRIESFDNLTCSQMNPDGFYHGRSIIRDFVSSFLSNFWTAIDHLSL